MSSSDQGKHAWNECMDIVEVEDAVAMKLRGRIRMFRRGQERVRRNEKAGNVLPSVGQTVHQPTVLSGRIHRVICG